MGRPLVRVTGSAATMLSDGDTQTFNTPSTGASRDNNRPSGDNLAPRKVGLSNSFWRGIKERTGMGPLKLCTLPDGGLRTAEEIQAGLIDQMVEAQVSKDYRRQSGLQAPLAGSRLNRAQQILRGRYDWR